MARTAEPTFNDKKHQRLRVSNVMMILIINIIVWWLGMLDDYILKLIFLCLNF